jgi:hypothetical protein
MPEDRHQRREHIYRARDSNPPHYGAEDSDIEIEEIYEERGKEEE